MMFYDKYIDLLDNGQCCGKTHWKETNNGYTISGETITNTASMTHYRAHGENNRVQGIFDVEVEHFKESHAVDWQLAILVGEVYKWEIK